MVSAVTSPCHGRSARCGETKTQSPVRIFILPADRPDLLVVAECLGPRRLPLNLENIKIPRAFYALDPHLNLYWHQKYASAFDCVFTTQQRDLAGLEV